MMVGAARLTLRLEGVDSLKSKRTVVRRGLAKLRQMDLSAAEVDRQDSLDFAVFGVAAVSTDRSVLERFIRDAEATLARLDLGKQMATDFEIVHLGSPITSMRDEMLEWSDFEESAE